MAKTTAPRSRKNTAPKTARGAKASAPPPPPEEDEEELEGEELIERWLNTESRVAKEYAQFWEAHGHANTFLDPLSAEGVMFQAKYIANVGKDPLLVLKSIAENPFCKPSDRVNASKVLLEYSRRKIPAQLELSGPEGGAIKLSRAQLAGLSDKELGQLEALLLKASAGTVKQ